MVVKKLLTKLTAKNISKDSKRPSKDEYYLDIAKQVAQRGTCLRRNFGAIIVKNDQIISTGYTGAPRGTRNCLDIGECPRQKAGVAPGERYELCRSVHAEMNCIIHAARDDMIGSTLYLYGQQADGTQTAAKPCKMCTRMIINAGIKKVVARDVNNSMKIHNVDDWIIDEATEFTEENMKGY